MKKGLFWCVGFESGETRLITVSVDCDAEGKSDIQTEYSSKSGYNFNHKAEWQKLGKGVTNGHPFNYYPRGRVEIKNGKAVIYLNPDINNDDTVGLIIETFGLKKANGLFEIKIKSDGSEHYFYSCKKQR